MIVYVDAPPAVEPHNGLFLMTAKSGDQTVQLALTRHALHGLQLHCEKADAIQRIADMNAPIAFSKRRR